MDEHALLGLRSERIDWRLRGFAPHTAGQTVAGLVAERPHVALAFTPPFAVLHERELEWNLQQMAEYCRHHGVQLAPHAKSTMAPQLVHRQLGHGALGITLATVDQVRVLRAFGVQRILLANEVLDPRSLDWLAMELAKDPGFELIAFVDSVQGVSALRDALQARGLTRQVPVLIEMGVDGMRAGCRDTEAAMEVARAASASNVLAPVGVAAFEGVVGDASAASLARVRELLRLVRATLYHLMETQAIQPLDGRFLVSAGGSAFFDLVVDELAPKQSDSASTELILRSGCYITHDSGHYARLTPSTRRVDRQPEFHAALEIWAQVTSRPERHLAIAGLGRRDASFDIDMPLPLRVAESPTARWRPAHGLSVARLSDQHAFVTLEDGTDLSVGDWVAFGVSHPCTTFDKWPWIPVVDEHSRVVDCIRTFF